MRIKFDGDADVAALKMHRNTDTGKLTITPSLVVTVNREQCAEIFGEPFAELAFGRASEIEGMSYTALKPHAVCEQHVVTFSGGEPIATQPKIAKVEPSSLGNVHVWVLVPIDYDPREGALLAGCYGEGVCVSIEPAQLELPGVVGNDDGSEGAIRELRAAAKRVKASGVGVEVATRG